MANENRNAPKNNKSAKSGVAQELVINGFNQLRQEQRQLANKIVELETDVTEHKLVIEALNEVDGSRKCFRMIGGVLVERTVNEVLPTLLNNKEMISQLIETLKSQVVLKGKEINEYMDKHNIQIRQEPLLEDAKDKDHNSSGQTMPGSAASDKSSSVLVDNNSTQKT